MHLAITPPAKPYAPSQSLIDALAAADGADAQPLAILAHAFVAADVLRHHQHSGRGIVECRVRCPVPAAELKACEPSYATFRSVFSRRAGTSVECRLDGMDAQLPVGKHIASAFVVVVVNPA